jgi:GR25 family glycosyltransferase involved in LPS biosynthesis
MRIYVVSCDKGRQERIARLASPLNLDLEVVDSPLAKDEEVQRRGKVCFERGSAYATGFAATLGHVRAMQRLLDTGAPYAIIVEDDVRFHKLFNEKMAVLEKYMNDSSDVDILSIGYCSYTVGEGHDIGEGMRILKNVHLGNPWGAQAYIITKKYADAFVHWINSEDDVSKLYSYIFVTDCIIFDNCFGCRRSTLTSPIVLEDPNEQTIAGNLNKPPMDRVANFDDFYFH